MSCSLFSLVLSAMAPDGRHPFAIDWHVDTAEIAFSIVKAPHIGATALLALLALLGTGRERWLWALVSCVLVGAGWELCQTTVIGHTARLADLAPDALGAGLGCLLGTAAAWTMDTLPTAAHRA
jgi:VanZ family protein